MRAMIIYDHMGQPYEADLVSGEEFRKACRDYFAASAEVERLRSALVKISKMPWENSFSPYSQIARDALAPNDGA